jgi:hypothetical protein
MKRHIAVSLLICAVAVIQGCASPAEPANMVALAPPDSPAPDPTMANAVQIRAVGGGSETNPLWVSKVSDKDFRTALEQTLERAGLLNANGEAPRYQLDAVLLSLQQPMFGLDLKVTCSVRYDLTDAATGKRIFGKTITTPFTATFSDSALAVARLRIANEGAVRKNLAELLDELLKLQPGQ